MLLQKSGESASRNQHLVIYFPTFNNDGARMGRDCLEEFLKAAGNKVFM